MRNFFIVFKNVRLVLSMLCINAFILPILALATVFFATFSEAADGAIKLWISDPNMSMSPIFMQITLMIYGALCLVWLLGYYGNIQRPSWLSRLVEILTKLYDTDSSIALSILTYLLIFGTSAYNFSGSKLLNLTILFATIGVFYGLFEYLRSIEKNVT